MQNNQITGICTIKRIEDKFSLTLALSHFHKKQLYAKRFYKFLCVHFVVVVCCVCVFALCVFLSPSRLIRTYGLTCVVVAYIVWCCVCALLCCETFFSRSCCWCCRRRCRRRCWTVDNFWRVHLKHFTLRLSCERSCVLCLFVRTNSHNTLDKREEEKH